MSINIHKPENTQIIPIENRESEIAVPGFKEPIEIIADGQLDQTKPIQDNIETLFEDVLTNEKVDPPTYDDANFFLSEARPSANDNSGSNLRIPQEAPGASNDRTPDSVGVSLFDVKLPENPDTNLNEIFFETGENPEPKNLDVNSYRIMGNDNFDPTRDVIDTVVNIQ